MPAATPSSRRARLSGGEVPQQQGGWHPSDEIDKFSYSLLGQLESSTDRIGNIHSFSYNVLGRLTAEIVGNTDGSIRRIKYTYDTAGRLFDAVTYDTERERIIFWVSLSRSRPPRLPPPRQTRAAVSCAARELYPGMLF
jgi:YD repeat-containing protein